MQDACARFSCVFDVATTWITAEPVEHVWASLTSEPPVPAHPSVRSLAVKEQTPTARVTKWELLVNGSVLHGTTRENFDPDNHRATVEHLAGDLASLQGEWSLADADGGATRLSVQLAGTFGLPLIGDVIDGNIQTVLTGLLADVARILGREERVS